MANPIECVSQCVPVSVSFTPAEAAYSANDVISTAKQFVNIGPPGGMIRILSSILEVDHTAVISGETSYRLYLYSAKPPSAHADNDAWDLPAGDRSVFLGYVDLGTPVDLGSTLWVQASDINVDVKLTTSGLWAELVTIGGFTATAAARVVTLKAIPL